MFKSGYADGIILKAINMFIRFIFDLVNKGKNYRQLQFLSWIEAILIRDVLLPFNEQVITLIGPEKRRNTFIQKHGLAPEEVAHLYGKGRILPILANAPIRFNPLSTAIWDFRKELKSIEELIKEVEKIRKLENRTG